MTPEQFRMVAEQVKPYTNFIYFHVKGEPLLHPQLERLLDIAYENGLQVNLTTNGTLLQQRRELLLSHPAVRQVNLSLHAFNETADIDNKNYLCNALNFAKDANNKGIYVVMRLWNLNEQQQTDLNSLDIMKQIEQQFGWKASLTETMGARKSVKISHHAFVGWEQEFEWPSLTHEFVSETGFCYGMRYQIAILVDGTVVPCCLDANGEEPLGNVFVKPFGEIIETNRAKAIRHGFENRICISPLCQRCSFRTKFDA